ncbi:cache domain-containing protein [Sulfurimonas sp. MAG313]|nr:cache domain-containing protein [Sulfurimonas sp. MAG313]MDF1880765.1 cache domain-containing protein [Sulfurimonas sp. MAG313]
MNNDELKKHHAKTRLMREKNIPRFMIVVPVVAIVILTVLITYFYISYRQQHFKLESQKLKEEYIKTEQKHLKKRLESLYLLLSKKYENMEEPMRESLKSRITIAYDTAEYLYQRYSRGYNEAAVKDLILGTLSRMDWNDKKDFIWVTDKKGNNLLARQKEFQENILEYKDADGRFIIKEEIASVEKYKEVFIKTRYDPENPRVQLMYIKDFGHFDWFFGTGTHHLDEYERIKKSMIKTLVSVQTDPDEYFYIVDSKGNIIYHPQMLLGSNIMDLRDKVGFAYIKEQITRAKKEGVAQTSYYSTSHRYGVSSLKTTLSVYFKPFDWIISTGFYATNIQIAIDSQQAILKKDIENEIKTILVFSFSLGIIVILLTIAFSRRISEIFIDYKDRVLERENALHELNDSLKEQVKIEVAAQREKEKMLIQQSKMAAMGDMISMIAHQWRQPLNQMSYVMMNIDGAYDDRTLSREYLDTKLKEGENLLEYMSHTIDDFRNFFKPDKEKEELSLCDLVDSAVGLIEKGFEKHQIILKKDYQCDLKVLVYKNEMIQVLLNLLKNAQEALLQIPEGKVNICIYQEDTIAKICISDNAGGIAQENMEKIFEPYFSTKAHQGTGLGLYMSKMIINEHMDGDIRVENLETGAQFCIELNIGD